uniref:Uncharacterized protein n=1 Tax=Arundo donax TaxID=35708 RepID=A0A0A9A684_ARUDO
MAPIQSKALFGDELDHDNLV